MQQTDWPAAVTWDPESPPALGGLHGVLSRLGGVPSVLLAAGASAQRSGWSAGAAIALADRAASSRSCVLFDLKLDGGELDERLGAENVEGVADIFLYGASLKHVVQRPANQRFEFVPSGLPADPARVLTDSRWQRLLGEVRGSDLQLLAYVPADAPGLEVLARKIGRFIALGEPDDLAAIDERLGRVADCVAVLAPPGPGPAPAADTTVVEVTAAPPVESIPEEETRRRPDTQLSLTEPTFVAAASRPPVKSRRGFYIALFSAVLLGVGHGVWSELRQQPELSTIDEQTAATSPTAANRVVPLPYSVAVEAHQELPLALERVSALTGEEPDIGFYVAPTLADGVLYYRVMAGPVADSGAAGALLGRLLERGHKTVATEWDIRAAPLAFLLGDFDSRPAAQERREAAAALSIPAYIIELEPPVGGTRYRVYAGAYAGLVEADVMRRLLKSAGMPDSLIQRVGTRR